jgi:hypothetical protein
MAFFRLFLSGFSSNSASKISVDFGDSDQFEPNWCFIVEQLIILEDEMTMESLLAFSIRLRGEQSPLVYLG